MWYSGENSGIGEGVAEDQRLDPLHLACELGKFLRQKSAKRRSENVHLVQRHHVEQLGQALAEAIMGVDNWVLQLWRGQRPIDDIIDRTLGER